MAEQVQLKLAKRNDEGFFGKAISNIGKAVYSSGSSLYTIIISAKRNNLLKHYANYNRSNEVVDENKRNAMVAKYEKTYDNYLATLEKYITETIYTKMQKRASTLEEEKIMSSYYEINALKGTDHVEYKNRMQMLLLNMEWASISGKNNKFYERYKEFYLYNIEELYKASMRHLAVLLANAKDGDKDKYEAIYNLIEDYIKNILPLLPETKERKEIMENYKNQVLALDTFTKKDYIDLRRKLYLLDYGKTLFVYSLPTVAAEQCYKEIISSARTALSNYFLDADKYEAYMVLLDSIEEYNENVLSRKKYWNDAVEEQEYKKFIEKWSELKKLARIDYDDFKNQREILFIKYDLNYLNKSKQKLEEVRSYYRDRMLQLHALRNLPNKVGVKLGRWRTRRRLKADESFAEMIEENAEKEEQNTEKIVEENNSQSEERVEESNNQSEERTEESNNQSEEVAKEENQEEKINVEEQPND